MMKLTQLNASRCTRTSAAVPMRSLMTSTGASSRITTQASSNAISSSVRVSRRIAVPSSRRPLRTEATLYVGAVTADKGMKFAVVVARFNSLVTKPLLEGAQEVFHRHGVEDANLDIAWVPGSFELPVVAKGLAKSGKYDAVVCIGAVIQGATSHYDAVVSAVTGGVLHASTDSGVPVIFGVLTTESLEQGLDRAGGKVGNKGGEAAETAIEMASLMKQLKAAGKV